MFVKRTEVWLGGRLIRQTQLIDIGPAAVGKRWQPTWYRWLYAGSTGTGPWQEIDEETADRLLGVY